MIAPLASPRDPAIEARTALSLGRLEDARRHFAAAMSHSPRDAMLLVEAAVVEGQLGAFKAAERMLEKALKLDPGNADGWYNMGQVARERNQLERAVRLFRKRYPHVRIYQPWNESNSRTQPTSGNRGARRVAQYYKTLVGLCRRRCLVTGADIQDIGDFVGYTRTFLRAVGRRKPRVMGFHNYTDTNRFRYRSTDRFVRAMPRGTKVWLTETGGIYSFTQQDGTVSLPPSEARAARSMSGTDSSSVAAWVTRADSSCASSMTTASYSGIIGTPSMASIASSEWLVTISCDWAAFSFARSAKHSVA